jgi:hypothetical protein
MPRRVGKPVAATPPAEPTPGPSPSSRALANAAVALVACLATAASAEATLLAALAHPGVVRYLPAAPRRLLSWIYASFDRRIIQFEPSSAHYDPDLFYRLNPGRFVFANREFSTVYEVNSLGVRDDEASLHGPEIVVAGDSFAMGWGVEQDQTFAQLLERRTGRRVLDAAVSSFGTAREMRLLDDVDFSRVRDLVVQYADNDVFENAAFARRGKNHLRIDDEATYRAAQQRYFAARRYFFGRYLEEAAERAFERRPPPLLQAQREAEAHRASGLFLNALAHGTRQDLGAVRIILVAPDADPGFVRAVAREARSPEQPVFIRRMIVLDLSTKLKPDVDFLPLDGHLNAAGHAVIAAELARHLS